MVISNLPLYWRLKDSIIPHAQIPETFNFEFDEIADLGLLIQKRTKDLSEHLSLIYRQDYNIGYIQEVNTLARPYYEDFKDKIFDIVRKDKTIKSIIEIGCGGALILNNLKEEGYRVVGVDPGPLAKRASEKWDLEIISDFFPSKLLDGKKFNFIYHSDVLEHVEDPLGFLREQVAMLEDGGTLLTSVPDCTDSIKIGDISMAMHQHLNYFDETSLSNTLSAAGLVDIVIEKAGYGGSLYGYGKKMKTSNLQIDQTESAVFLKKIVINSKVVSEYFKFLPEDTGFYIPIRSFPYLFNEFKTPRYRIFDDTNHWHNKYFDGYPLKVENMVDLMSNPPPKVIIMSLTFDTVIKNKMVKLGFDQKNIITLREILNAN